MLNRTRHFAKQALNGTTSNKVFKMKDIGKLREAEALNPQDDNLLELLGDYVLSMLRGGIRQ